MSIEDFTVYIAKGKSLEIAEAHFTARMTANKAREEHAKRHGGEEAIPYGDDFTYMGITTPNPPDPKAWKVAPKGRRQPQDTKWPCYVPNTRTKEGKALEEEMGNRYSGHGRHKVFSRPCHECFSHDVGIPSEFGIVDRNSCLLYARVGRVSDEVVILVPNAMKTTATPPDAERIPLSRYFAMKESAAQATA